MRDTKRKKPTPDEWVGELARHLGTEDLAAIRAFWQVAYCQGVLDASKKFVRDIEDFTTVSDGGAA